MYVTTTASSGVGCVGSVGTTSFLSYTYNFCSMFVFSASVAPCSFATYTDPSLNVTFNVPGNVPFASVVLFCAVVSSTVASCIAFSIVALSASFTPSAGATPFFQSNVAPTNSAKSTPFKPPNAFTLSAVVSCVAVAVNLKYPCLLSKALDDLVTFLSFGVHVTDLLYPSLNVISFSCGKSVSWNTVPSLAYVFPVVVILSTPVDAKNLTSILSLGRSSSFGASGSVLLGSTLTICSHTYSH